MGVSVNVGDGLVVEVLVGLGVVLAEGVVDGVVGEGLADVVTEGLGEAGESLGLAGAEIFGEGLEL
jgi:hypothetical protein